MADLKTTICGIEFPNPIWTAAGPASANADLLCQAVKGGAGALVTKTISVRPAKVPIPNIHVPFQGSLLNAELWSEMEYHKFIHEELPRVKATGAKIIVSVGYSPEDLSLLGKELAKSGLVDAVEFSIHYIGKDIKNLEQTATALKQNINVPVLAKLSPSIQDLTTVVNALHHIIDGFVAINSVGPALDFNIQTLEPYLGSEDGRAWLSGSAILPIGLHFVAKISELTPKPVIGVGGIRRVEDVIKYIMAGASAVQVCSQAILKGRHIYSSLAEELSSWMDAHHYSDIKNLRGIFHNRKSQKQYFLGHGPQLYPKFIVECCHFCDKCIKSCIHQAIHFKDKNFFLDKSKCVSCGLCISLCPRQALMMTEQEN